MSVISKSKIPTAGHVLNHVKGCPNCGNGICESGGFPCWAAAMCKRFAKGWAKKETEYNISKDARLKAYRETFLERYEKGFKDFKLQWLHSEFEKPFPVKASRIAVGWMSDISFWPRQWILKTIDKIKKDNEAREERRLPPHVFQFLTKFPEIYGKYEWPENCWLGFTALNEKELCEKWETHCDSVGSKAFPENKIFVYMEPITGAMNLKEIFGPGYFNEFRYRWMNWIIVGGQGLGAKKELNADWVRKIRDDCLELDIPFFFKGWGKIIPKGQEKGKLDGVAWERFPAV